MNNIWSGIQAWFAAKGGFTHVVAGAYASTVLAYAAVPAFANLLNNVYADFPVWAHELILAALGLAALYMGTKKPAEQT